MNIRTLTRPMILAGALLTPTQSMAIPVTDGGLISLIGGQTNPILQSIDVSVNRVDTSVNAVGKALGEEIRILRNNVIQNLGVIDKQLELNAEANTAALNAHLHESIEYMQHQTRHTADLMGPSSEYRYSDPVNVAGSGPVQSTPHPEDACEVADMTAQESAVRAAARNRQRANQAQLVDRNKGETFDGYRSQANWFRSLPPEEFDTTVISKTYGTLSTAQTARMAESVALLVNPEPAPALDTDVKTHFPQSAQTKNFEQFHTMRAEKLDIASDALNALIDWRAADITLTPETRDRYANWPWGEGVSPDNPNLVSRLELLRARATGHYHDPEFEESLLDDTMKSGISRLNRQLSVANMIAFARLEMEREAHAVRMIQYAHWVQEQSNDELSRLRRAAEAQITKQ